MSSGSTSGEDFAGDHRMEARDKEDGQVQHDHRPHVSKNFGLKCPNASMALMPM